MGNQWRATSNSQTRYSRRLRFDNVPRVDRWAVVHLLNLPYLQGSGKQPFAKEFKKQFAVWREMWPVNTPQ